MLLAINTLVTITSLIVFLAVITLLVIVLLIAKNYLVASGDVKIQLNGEKELILPAGTTLLNGLSTQGIHLPSACGGQGTCGQCKCQVLSGAGDILPTETGHFTRRQINDHWRLSCQVKIKGDLEIKIPEEILGVKEWECEVVSNKNVSTFIKEFIVKLPEGEHMDFIPGSYAQIKIPKYCVEYSDYNIDEEYREDWKKFGMYGLHCENKEETIRAYSMANYPAEGNRITLNVRIATPPFKQGGPKAGFQDVMPGISSSYIFNLKPGEKVIMSGPFGDFHPILTTKNEMLYIGGGAGMAPLRAHILHLLKTLKIRDRKISYWYGARSLAEVFYEEDFRALEKEFPNFSFHIALSSPLPEDHWTGPTGFIHQVIYDNYLCNHEAPEDIEYYMCGPGPMSSAAEKMLYNLGVEPENILFDNFGG